MSQGSQRSSFNLVLTKTEGGEDVLGISKILLAQARQYAKLAAAAARHRSQGAIDLARREELKMDGLYHRSLKNLGWW